MAGVAIRAAKTIGLALEKDLRNLHGTGAIIYKEAGSQRAGLTSVDYGRGALELYWFRLSFNEASTNADSIRFDVSSFDVAYPQPGITSWELSRIVATPRLLSKDDIYTQWRHCDLGRYRIRDTMKTMITPKEHGPALAKWRGAEAKLWLFHVSHNRMAIQLYRKGEQESLYIVALGCERISGPLQWDHAGILLRTEQPNHRGEVRQRLVDSHAGFELLCSDVAMVRMPPAVPPNPFDGFFMSAIDTP